VLRRLLRRLLHRPRLAVLPRLFAPTRALLHRSFLLPCRIRSTPRSHPLRHPLLVFRVLSSSPPVILQLRSSRFLLAASNGTSQPFSLYAVSSLHLLSLSVYFVRFACPCFTFSSHPFALLACWPIFHRHRISSPSTSSPIGHQIMYILIKRLGNLIYNRSDLGVSP
jgi:hypothetical protein